ncbi:hypothetical protein LguiA_035215 [Lonicera macranthoides]
MEKQKTRTIRRQQRYTWYRRIAPSPPTFLPQYILLYKYNMGYKMFYQEHSNEKYNIFFIQRIKPINQILS